MAGGKENKVGIIIVLLLFVGCTTPSQQAAPADGKNVFLVSDDNGQYAPAVIEVQRGETVRIVGDLETLVGGMDTIVVDGYGVEKKIAPNDNVLEFKADQPGEFLVHCANGMGNGKLIVR